jgi:hypothetical protein
VATVALAVIVAVTAAFSGALAHLFPHLVWSGLVWSSLV